MGSQDKWPHAFKSLAQELRGGRGRPCLISRTDDSAAELLGSLAAVVAKVVSLGQRVADASQVPTPDDLLGDLATSTLLVDIDVLFSGALGLDVVSQLRRTSMRRCLVVEWPGSIAGGRLSYSLPGRSDYVDEPARDLVVLRPAPASFPDEVPYTVERFPA